MRVMFVILGEQPVPESVVNVKYSEDEWRSFNTTTTTYSVPSRWWEPEGWQGWIYTTTVQGLQPGHVCTLVDVFLSLS